MAKINIEFDGKIYSVDEATLLPLASPLEKALIQQLAGTGAVIRLGGTNYEVDANKLASARNVLTDHFGNVAGTDSKVTINGAEYGLSKTKLQGATDKMHETLSGIGVATILPGLYETGSNYSVMLSSWEELIDTCIAVEEGALKRKIQVPDNLPQKNEYGFYYNTKYYRNFSSNGKYGYGSDYCVFYENGNCQYKGITYVQAAKYSLNSIQFTIYTNDEVLEEQEIVQQINFKVGNDGLSLTFGNSVNDVYSCGEELGFIKPEYKGDLVLPTDGSITIIDNAFVGAEESEGVRGSYITNILLPDSITEIKARAFENNFYLESINIPSGVTKIGEFTFYQNASLTEITLSDNITEIGKQAFSICGQLSLTLPQELETIGAEAFSDTPFISVTLPPKVISVDLYAFFRCVNLDYVIIPESVETIGEMTFGNCELLRDIYINKPEDSIQNAPWGAPKATVHWNSIGPEEQNISNGSKNLRYVLNEDGQSYAVETIGSCEDLDIIIPDTYNNLPVTAIGDNAFNSPRCALINSIVMSNNITSIGNYAFGRCDNLTHMSIGNGIANIDREAFGSGLQNNFDLYIDKSKDSISGAPWSGYYGNSVTIHWTDATDTYEWYEPL